MGENAGIHAAREVSNAITGASKNVKDGIEQIRYFGFATVDLLLQNPWIKLLIIIECCYTVFKTLQIVEQLKFSWRSVLLIDIVIVGLSIFFWPSFRVIAILMGVLTIAILFRYRRSFS